MALMTSALQQFNRGVLLTVTLLMLPALLQAEEWVHRMRAGETLSGISTRFLLPEFTTGQLQAHNQIENDRQIPVGTEIRIPLEWLKQAPAEAEVAFLRGEVTLLRGASGASRPLEQAEPLKMGDRLTTGPSGVVSIRFADGSRLLLGPHSEVTLDTLSGFGEAGMVDTRVRVQRGRVESRVKPLKGEGSRYEIHTPAAVTMVRGTGFRVAVEGSSGVTRNEVFEGGVAVAAGGETVAVEAGFGTLVEPGKAPTTPSRLLDHPDLSALPPRVTAGPVTLHWQVLEGADRYRLQLLTTGQDDALLVDALTPKATYQFAGLETGHYQVRVRGIDPQGLEGLSAETHLQVDESPPAPPPEPAPPPPPEPTPEPVPPAHASPQLSPPLFGPGWMGFRWSEVEGAWGYRLILARDATFQDPLFERIGSDPRLVLQQNWQGRFFVRVDALFQQEGEETHSETYRIEVPRRP